MPFWERTAKYIIGGPSKRTRRASSAPTHDCDAVIDEYLDHLRVERRLSPNTLESYARDLTALGEFAAGRERAIESLDRQSLEAFVRQQRNHGLSPRSVARRVAAVRSFYKFLVLDKRSEERRVGKE